MVEIAASRRRMEALRSTELVVPTSAKLPVAKRPVAVKLPSYYDIIFDIFEFIIHITVAVVIIGIVIKLYLIHDVSHVNVDERMVCIEQLAN